MDKMQQLKQQKLEAQKKALEEAQQQISEETSNNTTDSDQSKETSGEKLKDNRGRKPKEKKGKSFSYYGDPEIVEAFRKMAGDDFSKVITAMQTLFTRDKRLRAQVSKVMGEMSKRAFD